MEGIEVKYLPLEEGEESPLVVKILPVKRNQYREILDISSLLMKEFCKSLAFPGELLREDNENVWGNIAKLVEVLPLSGGGKLECDRLSDEDVIRIFFTGSTSKDEDGSLKAVKANGEEGYEPSEIARLHGFDFFHRLKKAVKEAEGDPQLTMERLG